MDLQNYVKTVYIKNGKQLEVKIGVHTGTVISGVLGELKPQFSLIGDQVYKTNQISSLAIPNRVTVSKETHHYLELYTNNYWFTQQLLQLKTGTEIGFTVQTLKGRAREKNLKDINFDGQLNVDKKMARFGNKAVLEG